MDVTMEKLRSGIDSETIIGKPVEAGDVTISRSPSSSFENAVRFRDASMLNATEFLTDVDFIFRTVDV